MANEVNVRDFIIKNYTPYTGDESFLSGSTSATRKLWSRCKELLRIELAKGGVLDIDTSTITGIDAHKAGYIDSRHEKIVGLQTDEPLKRAINPFGGIRMLKHACEQYDMALPTEIEELFSKYRTTHNDGVFKAYTDEMKTLRKSGVITGLPDAYGRGRIIGDYRRVPLYGVDYLVEQKKSEFSKLSKARATEAVIRLREELTTQIDALYKLKAMAKEYGYDIGSAATSAAEAVQWLYFAYLGAIKESNGAAMSLGRVSTFLDIYITRDLEQGKLTEREAQELIDQFVIKLRIVRHLRTQEYNELFAGDPVWITEALGGMGLDGRTLVTRTTFRMLHTLYNLGPAPEPNLTVLWSKDLPEGFKSYCSRVSIETSAIQYENDDLMRPIFGDDYGIACCVSAMKLGKQMQFFGARCNLPKLLLLSLNDGRDELTGEQIITDDQTLADLREVFQNAQSTTKSVSTALSDFSSNQNAPLPLDYEIVAAGFEIALKWLCRNYVDTMNTIHYMHDKYAYESLQMALHDMDVERSMAFGIAGLSVVTDSLSAIRYAEVTPVYNSSDSRLIEGFNITGSFPAFGNGDERVDRIASSLTESFYNELTQSPTYRDAQHTLSILTITSNIVYGKKTGATPDGRKAGQAFAPGANPMHHRDVSGVLPMLRSVASIPYSCCQDGISLTLSLNPASLGKSEITKRANLSAILDGYFMMNGHHLNINVMNRSVLLEAIDDPSANPQLTVRVSGYAVNFHRLTPLQQQEVIERTFHDV